MDATLTRETMPAWMRRSVEMQARYPGDTPLAEMQRWLCGIAAMRADSPPRGLAYTSIEDFVLQHGQAFGARPLPKGMRHGRIKECFRNAQTRALRDPALTYCEGFGSATIVAHHAWLLGRDGEVIDPTWRIGKGHWVETDVVYLGVPFPRDLVKAMDRIQTTYSLLDQWQHGYPLLKRPYSPAVALQTIHEILAEYGG